MKTSTHTSRHLPVHLNTHTAHVTPTLNIHLSAYSLSQLPHTYTHPIPAHTQSLILTHTPFQIPTSVQIIHVIPPTNTGHSHSDIHKLFTVLTCTPFNTHMPHWHASAHHLSPPQLSLEWTFTTRFLLNSCPLPTPLTTLLHLVPSISFSLTSATETPPPPIYTQI